MTTSEWEKRLGAEVRRLRVARGLTQLDLAEQANVSISTIRYLEAGRGSSLATLIRVAKVLDRSQWLSSFAPTAPSISPIQLLREQNRKASAERSRVRKKIETQ
ncbi:MAG: helix-turn-helix domain-containing protein [Acidimicrobiales bacterium]